MFELIRQDLKAYRNARGMIQWNEPSIFCVLFYRIGQCPGSWRNPEDPYWRRRS